MGDLTRTAVRATLHCLTGCAVGEVLGLALATWWGWSSGASIGLAVGLAFLFGYGFTVVPVLRSGLSLRRALAVALAADTVSIATMELVDNIVMLSWPGAMDAGLGDGLFWGSLLVALLVAFVLTVPVNRWLIARGRGHAAVHGLHGDHGGHGGHAGHERHESAAARQRHDEDAQAHGAHHGEHAHHA